jgi:hypothetical protein
MPVTPVERPSMAVPVVVAPPVVTLPLETAAVHCTEPEEVEQAAVLTAATLQVQVEPAA